MSKQQAPSTRYSRPESARWISLSSLAAWCVSLLLVAGAWVCMGWLIRPRFGGDLILLALLAAGLAVGLERALAAFPLSWVWRGRLAFILSWGVYLLHWVISPPSLEPGLTFARVSAALAGAFVGGLFATARYQPLWENNSPPSAQVQQEVYQRHLEALGALDRVAWGKRAFDISLAVVGLLLSAPLWALSVLLLWLEDPGPILFVKNSVGRGGINFHQYKFRTMVSGAETTTGPVLAREKDERVLRVGRFLRKTALDELPQLLNILRGEMSFVGPRPQRTVLVRAYVEQIPAYVERHRVLPGLAGLAQVAGDYYLTPRQKLRFDRLYIQHASLGFDLKLLCLACLITFWFRWQPGWNGRLPRKLIRFGGGRRFWPYSE